MAIDIANLVNQIAPLVLLSGADFVSVFTKPQLDALALGFLRLHSSGDHVTAAFWGLWLFPFGMLVIKSGFLPKLLGVCLIIGCFAWLTFSFTAIVFPAHLEVVNQLMSPLYVIGELPIAIWLLVKGVRLPRPEALASPVS